MKRGMLVLPTALAALALALWGCGGGDDGEEAITSFNVEGKEFEFVPDLWRVAANQDVTISFNNNGSLEHTWAVLNSTISTEDEFGENLVIFQVGDISGGSSTETFNLPPGNYQVICAIPGHFSAGMEGTLRVVEG